LGTVRDSPPFPMNFPLSLLCRRLAVVALLPLSLHAATIKEEMDALVAQTMEKIKAGQHTEAELSGDLGKFDALLAAHKGESADDLAKVLVLKAGLYTEIIGDDEKGLAVFRQLKADYPESTIAKDPRLDGLIASIEAKQAYTVGKVFPDFAEQDLDGKPLSVANYKGKVVLLDFWATWCGPCVAELPHVVAAYKKYHARGFEIIGISLDKEGSRQKLIDFTKSHDMPWVQYFDGKYWDNKLSTRYDIHSIPATFLIDREGRILAKDLRGEALDAELAKLLPAK